MSRRIIYFPEANRAEVMMRESLKDAYRLLRLPQGEELEGLLLSPGLQVVRGLYGPSFPAFIERVGPRGESVDVTDADIADYAAGLPGLPGTP